MSEHIQSTGSTAKAIYGKRVEAVHCLIIPVFGAELLLPNAAVAEVVSYRESEPAENTPEWFLGYINWRDLRVPLISFEAATGEQAAPLQKHSRIAIFNTLNNNPQLTHFGIVTQGIPHLQVVQEKQLTREETPAETRKSVLDYVQLNDEAVLVPDLDDLERRLLKLQAG
ncbi:MAG: chemotaxis protein CheW [Gammaproteobacteria bacterium]